MSRRRGHESEFHFACDIVMIRYLIVCFKCSIHQDHPSQETWNTRTSRCLHSIVTSLICIKAHKTCQPTQHPFEGAYVMTVQEDFGHRDRECGSLNATRVCSVSLAWQAAERVRHVSASWEQGAPVCSSNSPLVLGSMRCALWPRQLGEQNDADWVGHSCL